MSKIFIASAPGTLMISGEHAVLYQKKALVAAVDKRITVTLIPRNDNHILIHSQLGELKLIIQDFLKSKLEFSLKTHKFKFVVAAIYCIIKDFNDYFLQNKKDCGFDLTIESDFSHEVGLGSSAAVTVAVVSVLFERIKDVIHNLYEFDHELFTLLDSRFRGNDNSYRQASFLEDDTNYRDSCFREDDTNNHDSCFHEDDINHRDSYFHKDNTHCHHSRASGNPVQTDNFHLNRIFEKSKQVIRFIQGYGSGADVAAAIYGGILVYQKDKILKKLNQLIPIICVYSGSKKPTQEVIQIVQQNKNKQPELFEKIFNIIDDSIHKAIIAIEDADLVTLGEIWKIQQGLMTAMGVSTLAIDQLIHALNENTGIHGAKISGSGLGDCVIGVGKLNFDIANIIKENQIAISLSSHGLEIRRVPVDGRVSSGCESMGVNSNTQGINLNTSNTQVMNSKHAIVRELIHKNTTSSKGLITNRKIGKAFAPANIALCKYWGKRDHELNLPMTSSLSISLGNLGTYTTIQVNEYPAISNVNESPVIPAQAGIQSKLTKMHSIQSKYLQTDASPADIIILNGNEISQTTAFYQKCKQYLDLFRPDPTTHYLIHTQSNIPISAGLASSASGFAALIKALNDLYRWQLDDSQLSILARLGSGSACRSLWHGFVEWNAGIRANGSDSHGIPLNITWQELCIGVHIINRQEKYLSSRKAMKITEQTSPFYAKWPDKVSTDLSLIKQALQQKNFNLLGRIAESNAQSMHALMLSATPSINYSEIQTLEAIQQVYQLRREGLELYFTQDAGPNLKLLVLEKDLSIVKEKFLNIQIIKPFEYFEHASHSEYLQHFNSFEESHY